MYINDVLAQGLESGLIRPPQPIEMNTTSYTTEREPVDVIDYPNSVKQMHTNQDYLFSEEHKVYNDKILLMVFTIIVD